MEVTMESIDWLLYFSTMVANADEQSQVLMALIHHL